MVRHWMNWPLRTQLAVAVAVIMLVLLTLFSVVLFWAVSAFINTQTTAQLQLQARALMGDRAVPDSQQSALTVAEPTATQRTELQALAAALSSNTTSVVVYEPDGNVLTRDSADNERDHGWGPRHGPWGPPHPPLAPPTLDARAFEQALRGADDVSFKSYGGFERQQAVLMPIFDGSTLIGVLQLSTSLRPADALLRWLVLALVAGTLLVSMTALLLSFWATRAMLNPLRRLVGVTQQVGQGDLGARSNLRSTNEIGALGTAFDQMVMQLQAAFGTQRRFIADAAHELRTPLTAVGGQLEMLMLGAVSDPAQQRRALQRMNSELERMGRLVDDLLTLSRLDARPALRRETVDLALLAQDVAQQVRQIMPEHQLLVEAVAPAPIIGDPDRLRQVLLNVLDNGRKYTPAGGRVRISVEQRANNVLVLVSDTGVGIPPADVAHVWDRFYRVDQARTRARGGAGLGLAIVKGIVEAHGGTASLSSTLGAGTTVELLFPLAGSASSPVAHPQLPHSLPSTSSAESRPITE